MDDLKHLEGKAVKSIEQNNAGLNSYLIIKFTDDSKLNVAGYPHGDNGVAQLDIELEDVKIEEIKNRKIYTIEEEFDGDMDKLIINFKKGGKMVIGAFNSKEDATAGLETTVYVENAKKFVRECLEENEYKDSRWGYPTIFMSPQYEEETEETEEKENNNKEMKKFVKETLSEADWQRGNDDFDEYDELNMDDVEPGPPTASYEPEDETGRTPTEINQEEIDDLDAIAPVKPENMNPVNIDAGDIPTMIDNELELPEPDRSEISFRYKGLRDIHSGIPITRIGDNSVLFKVEDTPEYEGGLVKVNLADIVAESEKIEKTETWVKESIDDYKDSN